MNILGKKGLSGAVKFFLDLVFIGGIAIYISLPITLKWYFEAINRISTNSQLRNNVGGDTAIFMNIINSENYYFLLGLLYLTGFLALLIIFELKRILINLNKMNPFIIENVKSLKKISIASLLIAAAYVSKMFFFNSFLTIVITMIFVIASLFSIILAEVFKQAVLVKEENDLTV